MTVEMYTREGCGACVLTAKQLDRRGVDWVRIDLDIHPEKVDELKERGFTSLPVIHANDEWWAGYRPDRIRRLEPDRAPAPFQSAHVDHQTSREQPLVMTR